MTFTGFFTRSIPEPFATTAAPVDLDANVAAFESLPSWMTR